MHWQLRPCLLLLIIVLHPVNHHGKDPSRDCWKSRWFPYLRHQHKHHSEWDSLRIIAMPRSRSEGNWWQLLPWDSWLRVVRPDQDVLFIVRQRVKEKNFKRLQSDCLPSWATAIHCQELAGTRLPICKDGDILLLLGHLLIIPTSVFPWLRLYWLKPRWSRPSK